MIKLPYQSSLYFCKAFIVYLDFKSSSYMIHYMGEEKLWRILFYSCCSVIAKDFCLFVMQSYTRVKTWPSGTLTCSYQNICACVSHAGSAPTHFA